MTIRQIRDSLKAAGRAASREQTYRYITRIGVAPIGARQRPQQYPDGTDLLILNHLGANHFPVVPAHGVATHGAKALLPVARNNGTAWKTRTTKATNIPTLKELRAERRKARGK